ncbi:AraC family transcriptional regulator [Paenibacillus aurantiacus]|uniref:AraC family transcriptional regulator n=1 Tax=Paenibacillus aurantiacus TaxID=1936118 RepID=A0ABV5KLE6_9BACL
MPKFARFLPPIRIFRPKRDLLMRRMITISILASVIPIIFVGIFSYLYSSSTIKREVSESNIRLLSNASATIDQTLDRVQNNAMQLMLGSFFSSDLQELRAENYASFYSGIFQNLSAFQSANQEIRDIAMYTWADGYIQSPTFGGIRVDASDQMKQLYDELSGEVRFKWTTEPYAFLPSPKPSEVTLVLRAPLQTGAAVGLIFIRIDDTQFRTMIEKFRTYAGERIFIFGADGTIIAHVGSEQPPEPLYKKVHAQAETEQSFIYEWAGVDYQVTPIKSAFNGWTYTDMIPVHQLNKQANGIAYITLAIVAFFLLMGILISSLGTRKAYQPVASLLTLVRGGKEGEGVQDEMGYVSRRWKELSEQAVQLEDLVNRQIPIIRESFALQLLQGHFAHYSEPQLAQVFHRYNIPAFRRHRVLLVAYDPARDGENRFTEKDKDLIVFTIKNMAMDTITAEETGLDGIVIQLLDDQVAIWLMNDAGEDEGWREGTEAAAELMRERFANYLKVPITIGLSEIADSVSALPQLYQEAVLAVRSRFLVGSGKLISSSDRSYPNIQYRYPVEIEAQIENSLQLGDLAEARRMLDEFSRALAQNVNRPELIRMTYQQLLTTLLRMAYLLGIQSDQLFAKASNPYEEMIRHTTAQELHDWIDARLLTPIAASVQGSQSQAYEHVVEQVVHYLQEHYADDVSLDQCAQMSGISSHYLSKLFKKQMGISFIEYLTGIRVDQAKRYLQETDLPVNVISEKVGYQPKNFIRVFKKQVGVTPGQYRESAS